MGRILLESGAGALALEDGSGVLRAQAAEVFTLGVQAASTSAGPGSLVLKLTRLLAASAMSAVSAAGSIGLKLARRMGVSTANVGVTTRDAVVFYMPAFSQLLPTPVRRRAMASVGDAGGAAAKTVCLQPCDPTDHLDWVHDFDNMLEDGEEIDTFTIGPAPEGVALGLTVDETSQRAPRLDSSGRAVALWLLVDGDEQADPAFSGAGSLLGIETTVLTNMGREEQRTFYVRMAQQ